MSELARDRCPECGWPTAPSNWIKGVCKWCSTKVVASGEEAGKILEDMGAGVELCPDCDLLLPHGAPPGRCDRCEFKKRYGREPHTLRRDELTGYAKNNMMDGTDLPTLPDMVNDPPHYKGHVEAIEAIAAALGPEGFDAYCRGAAMKYIYRCERKGNKLQDLKKAKWYIERIIDECI